MNQSDSQDQVLHDWLNGSPSASLNQEQEYLSHILSQAAQLDVPPSQAREEAFAKVQDKISRRQLRKRFVAVAASLAVAAALLLGLRIVWQPSPATQQWVTTDQLQQFTLPDGSKVTLNKQSALHYSPTQWDKVRTVSLQGEAFFEVAKGSRFLVKTEQGQIQTLGTAFDVFQRDDRLEVAVFHGQVAVIHHGQTTQLSASEKLVIHQGQMQSTAALSKAEYRGWREGSYIYDNELLTVVLGEVERQYGVTFQNLKTVEDERIRIVLDNQYTLEEVLQTISAAKSIEFELQGSQISIRK